MLVDLFYEAIIIVGILAPLIALLWALGFYAEPDPKELLPYDPKWDER